MGCANSRTPGLVDLMTNSHRTHHNAKRAVTVFNVPETIPIVNRSAKCFRRLNMITPMIPNEVEKPHYYSTLEHIAPILDLKSIKTLPTLLEYTAFTEYSDETPGVGSGKSPAFIDCIEAGFLESEDCL